MFKKVSKKQKIIKFDEENNENELNLNEDGPAIDEIKKSIEEKLTKPKIKGISLTVSKKFDDDEKEQNSNTLTEKPETNQKFSTIRKEFLPETLLNSVEDDKELKRKLGIDKQDIKKQKEERKQKVNEIEKDLYELPEHLKVEDSPADDYVESLLRLAHAGLIEVPLLLQDKYKQYLENETLRKRLVDKKLKEELDFLQVLQRIGPSYSRGYKSDISKKNLSSLNKAFDDAFLNPNSRKKRLLNEKRILENRLTEDLNN